MRLAGAEPNLRLVGYVPAWNPPASGGRVLESVHSLLKIRHLQVAISASKRPAEGEGRSSGISRPGLGRGVSYVVRILNLRKRLAERAHLPDRKKTNLPDDRRSKAGLAGRGHLHENRWLNFCSKACSGMPSTPSDRGVIG